VALADGPGRVLAEPLYARQDSPGQSTAAMDGYAVCDATTAPDQLLRVAGESRAGLGFPGIVGAGEAVRIFTGAPMPAGTDRCIVQEHAIREGGNDLARPMFAPYGLELLVDKVAIKPGKPVWLGHAGGRWVLGLPGNPNTHRPPCSCALLAALQGQDAQERLR